MWLEGLVVFVVVALALAVGLSCMHLVDTPSRYAQPDAARAHAE